MLREVQPQETEVVAKAKRRTFTAKYKREIVRQADACKEPGEVGALLRREGGPVSFHGFVEGNDIGAGVVDVVVTDGFTGNVALKTLEGAMKFVMKLVLDVINTNETTQAAGAALFEHLLPAAANLSPDSHGGAMLLGLDGICIISHGSSNATAIMNALRVGAELSDAGVVDALRATIRPDQA